MPSADQVPVKTAHSTMHWHKWVVLIAGSTGSALRAVRPSNLHITPNGRRDRRDLGWPPRQQCGEPGPVLSAMDLGIADHGQRASGEQAAQITIALFADTAELVLTAARVLLRHE